MELYSKGKNFKLYNGNMLDMLSEIKPNSIDSIVTDPPYEIGFMCNDWDSAGISFQKATWEKCYTALKPGGHMLVFGSPRTFHRIACAIEDAGFEIRDVICWLYGSGFPKSMNIGLAVDKKNGVESKVVGYADTTMPDFNDAGHKNSKNKVGFNDGESAERKAQPIFEVQNEWQGWGTTLKPSYEPILMCRKPCEGTTVDNVLKWSVGGINIDECRVPLEGEKQPKGSGNACHSETEQKWGFIGNGGNTTSDLGRYPSNTILTYDETDYDEVCGGFPDTKSTQSAGVKRNARASDSVFDNSNCGFQNEVYDENRVEGFNDSGSAARYFYCAKASKRDRDEGVQECGLKSNNHPTVKPQSLMQYLIRLVTPPHGTVFDPFTGSGSTGKATMYENADRGVGYKFIGIELDKHHCDIATARISYAEGNPIMLDVEDKYKSEQPRNTLFDL